MEVRIDWLEGNFAASVEGLAVVATHETLEGVKEEFAAALDFHLEGMAEDGEEIPEVGEFDYKLSTRAILKVTEGIIDRKALAFYSGIHVKQLGHYFQGVKVARIGTHFKIVQGIKRIKEEIEEID